VQWRGWQGANGKVVDQLQEAIDLIRHNPSSRRILVNAWNAAEVGPQDVALPPCHNFFQFYVADKKLSLQMYQRSCDMFLGVPLNIASYSLLLHMVARITGLVPHEFIHVLGDAHIYMNHIDAVKEQLSREPYPLPQLQIKERGQVEIGDFMLDDFELVNYHHCDPIKAEMAV
jgi:thymidylate synthase